MMPQALYEDEPRPLPSPTLSQFTTNTMTTMGINGLHPPVASSSRALSPTSMDTTSPFLTQEAEEDDTFDPFALDPAYRLRTVRTAHSVLAESIMSERDAEKRKRLNRRTLLRTIRRKASTMTPSKDSRRKRVESDSGTGTDDGRTVVASEHGVKDTPPSSPKVTQEKGKGKAKPELPRRTVFVNIPLPSNLLKNGVPIVKYVRNKVRTSKYTIITFLPKNLFEQFRRVANIYFLVCVILQVVSVFGATMPQIGMLPLVAILGMTAIKDGIEDWRRARLDNEVNNSATTKLEGWRNLNQPKDSRDFWQRLFGRATALEQPSKGVRKLREKEASLGHSFMADRKRTMDAEEELGGDAVENKESIPLDSLQNLSAQSDYTKPSLLHRPSYQSMSSKKSGGVLDWSQRSSGTARWERTLWKKLEVGDLVLLQENEQVPADIIILSTSNPDSLAFVETKNLDGETNLKIRKGLKATCTIQAEEDLEHAKFVIDSEPPHANLYAYNGVLKYSSMDGPKTEEKHEAVTINELLLRGCTLRNTKWVIGMVIFTGQDTKIMLNGGDTPSKRSKIEKETNFNVLMNFVILIILCLTTAILHGWYQSLSGTSADYYEVDSEATNNIYLDALVVFASCLIVFQNIVPISLYITIEIVKTVQAYFIFQDTEMYYEAYDTPCVPKTWNISDDLGQIEYVFSDKTGTLTQNIMEFKKCSVHGVTLGEGMTEAMLGAAKRQGQDVSQSMADQDLQLATMKDEMVKTMKQTSPNRYFREDKLTLVAPDLPRRLADPSDPIQPHLVEFFRALSLCHSVLADVPDPKRPFELEYKAESPDEAALVAAARDVGFPFVARNNQRIEIEVLGQKEVWTPLRVLEFNSSRKRMSVVVRDPQGRIVLLCKGADSVIYERLDASHDPDTKASTLKDLEIFANGGLRTLCVARRYISEEEFSIWSKTYDAATAAVIDREGEIDKACELIEHSLTILGATALEDKLQEGVPDAIALLHKAGIKLWILTGDKLQTAIEIGYSCNLLTNDMEVMIISATSEVAARAQIEAGLNKIASTNGPPIVNKEKRVSTPRTTFAVVIDGESLRYALGEGLKGLFLSLGTQCSAVICCRVSPSQKAQTVKLVKEGCKAMTLSIGDGANDVAMIQEANVGVGLYGLEGSQAAMSADYAFGQFRFLTRLLLVHGRWSYVRIADMHANFFYKNIVWTVSMFWFLIFNSFDATYLFEYTFILLFNLAFTSLPVGVLGAFDQDTNAKASLAFPQLYKRGIQGLDYTRKRFWLYMGDGLYQSLVIFFIPFFAYGSPWSSTGLDTNGLYDFGTAIAVAGVFAANLYVGVNTRYWTYITAIVSIASILLIYLWIPIYSVLSPLPFSSEMDVIFTNFAFWALTVLTVFIAVGPRWLASAIRQSYFPRDKDIVREAWIAGDLKKQLGVAHRRETKVKSQPSIHEQLSRVLDRESAYGYEIANTSSPQRDIYRSPLISGASTPRSTFSYPPISPALGQLVPHLASPGLTATVPAPLHFQSRASGSVSPARLPPPLAPTPIDSPMSQISYTSPSAVEAFNLATNEIERLSQASTQLKRASLTDTNSQSSSSTPMSDRPSARPRPAPEKRVSLNLENRRSSRRVSVSPQKRYSMPTAPVTGLLGLSSPTLVHSPQLGLHSPSMRDESETETLRPRASLDTMPHSAGPTTFPSVDFSEYHTPTMSARTSVEYKTPGMVDFSSPIRQRDSGVVDLNDERQRWSTISGRASVIGPDDMRRESFMSGKSGMSSGKGWAR